MTAGAKVIRSVSWLLFAIGALLYVAAKIDFFRHYEQPGYLREHSAYWLAMCALGLAVWVLEQLASRNATGKPGDRKLNH